MRQFIKCFYTQKKNCQLQIIHVLGDALWTICTLPALLRSEIPIQKTKVQSHQLIFLLYGSTIHMLSGEKIKLVNVDSASLRILSLLVKKHFTIIKEGWDRQAVVWHERMRSRWCNKHMRCWKEWLSTSPSSRRAGTGRPWCGMSACAVGVFLRGGERLATLYNGTWLQLSN